MQYAPSTCLVGHKNHNLGLTDQTNSSHMLHYKLIKVGDLLKSVGGKEASCLDFIWEPLQQPNVIQL